MEPEEEGSCTTWGVPSPERRLGDPLRLWRRVREARGAHRAVEVGCDPRVSRPASTGTRGAGMVPGRGASRGTRASPGRARQAGLAYDVRYVRRGLLPVG